MTKIESGNMQMLDTSFDLRALLDSCCSIVEGQIVDRHMTFTKQIGPFWHPYLIGSELHIRQVLINILSNAVKYTPDGGEINFRAKETLFEEGLVHLRMEIKDNGIGMSEEFLQHIFEPFTQEQRSSRTHYKGTGLGMAITKKLVDQMHGSLDVESEPGKGSTFIVRLSLPLGTPPKAEPSVVVRHAASAAASGSSWDDAPAAGAETAAAAPAAAETVLPLAGLHLLLAEDNELNSEIATTLLEEQGASPNPTTVYRYLDKLAGEQRIMKYVADKGEKAVFQYVDEGRHCREHLHLKCVQCGRIYHLDCHFMDEVRAHLMAEHGFTLQCEGSVLYGLCRHCAQNAPQPEQTAQKCSCCVDTGKKP